MPALENCSHRGDSGLGVFATTHWSVVLAAGQESSGTARDSAGEALERLCRTYWQPVYVYVRSRAGGAGQAEDLTQEFFLRLLDGRYLAQVDPRKGRFRSFLFVAINHFLSNERDRVRAVKRGGRISFLSLDELSAEHRQQHEPATRLTPEKIFEHRWATALLAQVLSRLRGEFASAGKEALFDELKVFLTDPKKTVAYRALAERLGTTEAALKMRVQRMRCRYGELLRDEIARTVADSSETEDELRHLFVVLAEH